MMGVIVIYGPTGSGKTRNGEYLRNFFGAKRVVDEWDGKTELQDGDLALTNTVPPFVCATITLHIHAAVALAGGALAGGKKQDAKDKKDAVITAYANFVRALQDRNDDLEHMLVLAKMVISRLVKLTTFDAYDGHATVKAITLLREERHPYGGAYDALSKALREMKS